jgi:predicted metal-dependent phosphoesterase TrpH
MTADMHTHTVHSDGTTTPSVNAALAAQAGLRALALTDHDTFAGWEEAREACARRGLVFVPGIELSTEWRGAGVHVLGYWPDPDHPELAAECARLRHERARRAEGMVARLAALGMEVDMERIRAIAGTAPIGRPHVAAAMVEAGVVADIDAAFTEWIGEGMPAYEPKHALHPVEAVRLLRAAGGAPVLAHPGLSLRDPLADPGEPASPEGGVPLDLVDEMVAAGLAGIEADHAGHPADVADRWRNVAQRRHLVVTGSSDFHGTRKDVPIGIRTTSAPAWTALREEAFGAGGAR